MLILGINHRTAAVALRERVAFPEGEHILALKNGARLPGVLELGLLSTCNRTELFVAQESGNVDSLVAWWSAYLDVDSAEFAESLYCYRGEEAARHIMRVASGLDSMVLGEPQILGQLKDAYALARDAGTTGSQLTRLFEHAFSVAKRVRTETAIGENPVSVAYAAVSMARQIFADLSRNSALLIGAGKTIELVARHLQEVGVKDITIANRSTDRADALAKQLGCRAIGLAEIPDALHLADIVISSTASQLPILGKGAVERAIKRRKHKPMFMVDIAVPRDVEQEVSELDDVFLYTVDDLRDVIAENLKSREGAAQEAEHLIETGASEFMYQLRALDAVSTLKQFRQQSETLRDQEVDKALRALQAGADPETLLRSMARSLTNKFLHEPTVRVRKATAEGRSEAADWLRELHGLVPLTVIDDNAPRAKAQDLHNSNADPSPHR
ncbi:MAG: glutamyl-tRNA reductase [Halomonadaceae bacterium]|nr:MAG: glutamyl-tRNA reductase [Halomonadaceae bacterium]